MLTGFRSNAVQHADMTVHIQQIKPWPPSQSFKSLKSVVLAWENGADRVSGATNAAAPSAGPGSSEGKIEFNESFTLRASFNKGSLKSNIYQKNMLDLSLYELRKDRTRGKQLGSAAIDLSAYANARETTRISVPISPKNVVKATAKPMLYVTIEPCDSMPLGEHLSEVPLKDKDANNSGLKLMNEGHVDEVEFLSFTDDEVDEQPISLSYGGNGRHKNLQVVNVNKNVGHERPRSSSEIRQRRELKPRTSFSLNQSVAAVDQTGTDPQSGNISEKMSMTEDNRRDSMLDVVEKRVNVVAQVENCKSQQDKIPFLMASSNAFSKLQHSHITTSLGDQTVIDLAGNHAKNLGFSTQTMLEPDVNITDVIINNDKEEVKEVYSQGPNSIRGTNTAQKLVSKPTLQKKRATIGELERTVEHLEHELQDATFIEVSLYSILADHGSSVNKVHTPAQRLSKYYLHMVKNCSREKITSAARNISSGLATVVKSCGNDVARLSFWLSNCVVMRAIISQTVELEKSSMTEFSVKNPAKRSSTLIRESHYQRNVRLTSEFAPWENSVTLISSLKQIESWIIHRIVESIWWQVFTPSMHMHSLSKVGEPKACSKETKIYGRARTVIDDKQINLSTNIWKKAFFEASERLCPMRAAGHECGCLPMMARMVMEQCLSRLDVAMFNALTWQGSEDDIAGDPISDAIPNFEVLPIPAGSFSFKAGVQLKNAIGSWSRYLSDLFEMDLDDSTHVEDKTENDEHDAQPDKSFLLLNALSDLLMLPKEMLLNKYTRTKLFPMFSSSLIASILERFIPDEFCPELVPEAVRQALESEDHAERTGKGIHMAPYVASPTSYSSSAAFIRTKIGVLMASTISSTDMGKVSDEELEEMNSPLASVVHTPSNPMAALKQISNGNIIRYHLLRKVWISSS